MADEHDNDAPTMEEQFEQWYEKRRADEKRKADRNKEPKNFGEFLDRIADAVFDRAEERAEARRKAAEDDDEAPSRGSGPSRFQQFWSGGEAKGA